MFELKREKPLVIAGPCSAETREQTLETARRLAATGRVDMIRAGIWKPRTRPGTFEGVGVRGLSWLDEARKETGLPVAVEVASSKHVENALEFGIDALWIGARTTVNPFSVQDIADALRGVDIPVLVKNPMNPDVELWQGAVQRLQAVGVDNIGLIHRGFSTFGASSYRNNPMWHIPIEMHRRMPELPMICDPSHITGKRAYVAEVAQRAADMGFDGLIVESHITPDEAWSDAAQQLTPESLAEMLDTIQWRRENVDNAEFKQALEQLRGQIDHLDAELLAVLSRRMGVAEKIGMIKKENNVTILQANRWGEILEKVKRQSQLLNLSEEFLGKILEAIHVESINRQNRVMNEGK
ncbi:MAG: chorismate mutase [Rikenellaceae bacterium]|nr:chorismate mutase [Rikenellaceae bacterium]